MTFIDEHHFPSIMNFVNYQLLSSIMYEKLSYCTFHLQWFLYENLRRFFEDNEFYGNFHNLAPK